MARDARRYDIYLPLTFNDGRPIPEEHFEVVKHQLLSPCLHLTLELARTAEDSARNGRLLSTARRAEARPQRHRGRRLGFVGRAGRGDACAASPSDLRRRP